MKVLIVYDSVFGNTEKIVLAISKSFNAEDNVELFRVGDLKPEQLTGIDLLFVGSPTRGFQPTPAMKTFLKNIPANRLKGIKVAAFDTRITPADIPQPFLRNLLSVLIKIFGYAAEPIADKLQQKGGILIIPPEGFFVKASEGPLKDGEIEHAANWVKSIIKA